MKHNNLPLRVLIREMIEPGEHLYAVADAARDSYLASSAFSRFGIKTYSLFKGDMAPLLDHVAPHLVPVSIDSKYLELWSERLGSNAGILLLSREKPEKVYKHLRKKFETIDEDGNDYFFRFFDPRVLRAYLPTCIDYEAKIFFGPIRRILVEDEEQDWMFCCTPSDKGVKMDKITLYPLKNNFISKKGH